MTGPMVQVSMSADEVAKFALDVVEKMRANYGMSSDEFRVRIATAIVSNPSVVLRGPAEDLR